MCGVDIVVAEQSGTTVPRLCVCACVRPWLGWAGLGWAHSYRHSPPDLSADWCRDPE